MKFFSLSLSLLLAACTFATALVAQEITVYSGRSKSLVDPLFAKFTAETGIKLNARYGDTAELAATLMEEGGASPCDVFFAQDAGALGAISAKGLFSTLDQTILDKVDAKFRSDTGLWVGVSGRARVLAYSVERIKGDDLPDSVFGLTRPEWKGRVGWPSTNASFQSFVTAMRLLNGDEKTKDWLVAMKANGVKDYAKNAAAVQAVASGEVDAVLVNHYYLYGFLKTQPDFPVANYFFDGGDAGALVNVAGVGIMKTSKAGKDATTFVDWLLGNEAQTYFATDTVEYPLASGVAADPRLVPLAEIEQPNIDLSNLDDLQGTLKLMREAGVLP